MLNKSNITDLTEKEKILIDLRKKQIEIIDKDTTKLSIQLVVGSSIVFFSLLKLNIIKENYLFTSFVIFLLILIYFSWFAYQQTNYIMDCYDALSIAIDKRTINKFKVPSMDWKNAFFYKKKY